MRGTHVAAAIAFIVTAQCLPIPRPANAAAVGPLTAWQMQGTRKQEKGETLCSHMALGE